MERTVYLENSSFWVDTRWTNSGPAIYAIECLSDVMLYRRGWLIVFKNGQKILVDDASMYTMDREQNITLESALLQELMHEPHPLYA